MWYLDLNEYHFVFVKKMDLIRKILKDLKWFYGFQKILWILSTP